MAEVQALLKNLAVLVGIVSTIIGISAIVGMTDAGQAAAAKRGLEVLSGWVSIPALVLGVFLYWWGNKDGR